MSLHGTFLIHIGVALFVNFVDILPELSSSLVLRVIRTVVDTHLSQIFKDDLSAREPSVVGLVGAIFAISETVFADDVLVEV